MGQTNEFNTATNVNYKGANVASSFNVQSGDETAGNNTILNNNFNSAGAALLGVASGNGNQAIGIIGWSKKPARHRHRRLHRRRGRLRRRVLRRTCRGSPAPRWRGADHVDQRPSGRRDVRGPGRHAVALHRGRLAGHVAGDRRSHRPPVRSTPSPHAGSTTAGRAASWHRETTAPISVANATDGTLDVVPAKATAVALTVTVTETEGTGGFVAVRPAGTVYNGTSSINWFGPNQNLATTVISGLDADRQITLRAGAQSTQDRRRRHRLLPLTTPRRHPRGAFWL